MMLIVGAIAFALTSCADRGEIDIKYQVNVTVDPSTVQSVFNGYYVNGKTYGTNMYDTAKLLITSLIYDNSGNLVDKKESLVDDYNSSVRYSLELENSKEYTIVAITFSIDETENIDSYLIDNEKSLDKLTITAKFSNGSSFYSNWSMLGLATQTVNLDNKDYIIDVKPVSSIVVLTYYNIHALDAIGVDTHWIAYSNNDRAKFGNGVLEYGATLPSNAGWVHDLDVTENPNANNIFVMLNLLPTPEMSVWAGYYIGENEFEYSELGSTSGRGEIDIEAGKEYYFDVNCRDLTISLGNLTKSGATEQSMLPDRACTLDVITPQQSVNVMELIKTL